MVRIIMVSNDYYNYMFCIGYGEDRLFQGWFSIRDDDIWDDMT